MGSCSSAGYQMAHASTKTVAKLKMSRTSCCFPPARPDLNSSASTTAPGRDGKKWDQTISTLVSFTTVHTPCLILAVCTMVTAMCAIVLPNMIGNKRMVSLSKESWHIEQSVDKCTQPFCYPRIWLNMSEDVQGMFQFETFASGSTDTYRHDLPMDIRTTNDTHVRGNYKCKPFSKWSAQSFPTCNTIHEFDIPVALSTLSVSSDDGKTHDGNRHHNASFMKYLGRGGTRHSWVVRLRDEGDYGRIQSLRRTGMEQVFVIKVLRWKKEYTELRFRNQRVDALVTERLTFSRNVVDIYSHCAMTVVNEAGDDGDLFHFIEDHGRSLSPAQRLILARDAAIGMADIQGIDGQDLVSLIHDDVKAENVVVVDGTLKYHDFNNAKFLQWDWQENRTCGFRTGFKCRELRSPEECQKPDGFVPFEKVDTYRLGVILFMLLTGKGPFNFEPGRIGASPEEVRHWLISGRIPSLPKAVEESADPAITALVKATRFAMTFDIEKRPSALNVATQLDQAVLSI